MKPLLPTRLRLSVGALATVTALVVSACSAASPTAEAPIVSDGPVWETVSELVTESSYFVIGEVLDRGPGLNGAPPDEPALMLDTFRFRVDEVLKGDVAVGQVIMIANRADVDRMDDMSRFAIGDRLLIALALIPPAEEHAGSENFPNGVFVPRGGSDIGVFDVGPDGIVLPRSKLIRGATPGSKTIDASSTVELSLDEVRAAVAADTTSGS
jgi:hypothetical protein